MKLSNSARARSTDQAKGTDVDVADGEGWWADSGIVGREYRGKGVDGVGSVEGPARPLENPD